MKRTLLLILMPVFLASTSFCQTNKKAMDYTTVKELDLQKYMGTWYEIARYDHSFERGLAGCTANYSFRPDGKIKVINQGYKGTLRGKFMKAAGKAKLPDKKEPGKLKVSFFLFFYADYYVLELGENYDWALIGSSTDKYLWILSRTPKLEPSVYQKIIGLAQKRGYDTTKLLLVEQGK
jgi:apolipoprotein D and lipocalin family protein